MALEQTIIGLAHLRLREMRGYRAIPHAREDFFAAFHGFMTLVELARVADSGLSPDSTAVLLGLEAEACELAADC